MKILSNVWLKNYTTIRIGGLVKTMLIPETVDELKNVINVHGNKFVFGGGSNLLASDEHEFDFIVNLREFNKELVYNGGGKFTVGASVRLQQLINTVNLCGYGGIEYLYSVPGLVGGAVFMNAGGGKNEGNSISDYIVSVSALYDGKIVTLEKKDCDFSYRSSVFKKDKEYMIVSVEFDFPEQIIEVSKKKIEERMEFSKRVHDISYPNFGSVFKIYDPHIMSFVRRMQRKKKFGVRFSSKTDNWLINCGDGTYSMALKRINKVKRLHRIFHRECQTEVIIWD